MFAFFRKVLGKPKVIPQDSIPDPVVGEWKLSDDADWWEGEAMVGTTKVSFKIGGEEVPDTKLVAHAHEIHRSWPEFEQRVMAFLAEEAGTGKSSEPFAEEVRQLKIEDVCLLRPERPDDGMIYFSGPDEFRVWRCDYVGRRPCDLGFDD